MIEIWNATERPLTDGTVLDRFTDQVSRRPDAVAVRCRGSRDTRHA